MVLIARYTGPNNGNTSRSSTVETDMPMWTNENTMQLFFAVSASLPKKMPPAAMPSMNAASTALTANTVTPNTRLNIRVHTTSYTRLQEPERKKRRTRTMAGGFFGISFYWLQDSAIDTA